jgi:hypothetical protein
MDVQFAGLSHPVPAGDLAHAWFQLRRKQSAQTRFEKALRIWKLVAGENHSPFADNVLRVVRKCSGADGPRADCPVVAFITGGEVQTRKPLKDTPPRPPRDCGERSKLIGQCNP